jgi:hypothetical protein
VSIAVQLLPTAVSIRVRSQDGLLSISAQYEVILDKEDGPIAIGQGRSEAAGDAVSAAAGALIAAIQRELEEGAGIEKSTISLDDMDLFLDDNDDEEL